MLSNLFNHNLDIYAILHIRVLECAGLTLKTTSCIGFPATFITLSLLKSQVSL